MPFFTYEKKQPTIDDVSCNDVLVSTKYSYTYVKMLRRAGDKKAIGKLTATAAAAQLRVDCQNEYSTTWFLIR